MTSASTHFEHRLAALALAALLVVSACSHDVRSSAFSGPYGSDMKDAYENATDPNVRDALEDGVVSRAEYEAAYQRFVSCAHDRGVEVTLEDSYGLYTYSTVGPGSDEVVSACTPVVETIAAFYADMLTNPSRTDPLDLSAACLRRAGVVDRDYDAEQLSSDLAAGTGPFAEPSSSVDRCMINPQSDQ